MESKEIFQNVKAATVAIGALNKEGAKKPFTIFGSGFCIDPQGIVVTCQHVISAFMSKSIPDQIADIDPKERDKPVQKTGPIQVLELYAIFYNPKVSDTLLFVIPSKVDLVMAKTDYDLGLLRLLPHKHLPNGYPYLEIENYKDVCEGDEVGLCGFPLGDFLFDQIGTVTSSFTRGIISSIIPSPGVNVDYLKGFQLNLAATHGNSGGPVFSLSSGKVFGVLQRGIKTKDDRFLDGLVKAEPIYPLLSHKALDMVKNAKQGSLPDFDSTLGAERHSNP